MKSTEKRKVGLGDHLYGIPLEDILTPEQIHQMKQKRKSESSSRRKSRKKMPRSKGFRKKSYGKQLAFHIPRFNIDRKLITIVSVVIALIVVFFLVKDPILSRVAPKYYVKNAINKTFKSIEKDFDKAIEGVFGFDLLDKKEVTAEFSFGVTSDSTGRMAGLSVNGRTGYSKKDENLFASWEYAHKGRKFASVGMYSTETEVGFNVPELFSEYWVAPATTFGRDWNDSGLRKVLYKNPMGNEADLSFGNLFRERHLLSETGLKSFKNLTNGLISSSDARYIGKETISVDGKAKKGRKFTFTFGGSEIRNYMMSLIDVVLNDSETKMRLSYTGSYDKFRSKMTQLSSRFENGIVVNDATAHFVEYNGRIMKAEIRVHYTENGVQDVFAFDFVSENAKNITDNMRFSLSTGREGFSVTYATCGNHTVKWKVFEDYSSIKVIDEKGTFELNSSIKLDFKNKLASGSYYVSGTNGSYSVHYGGNCNKKGGLAVDLTNVSVNRGEGGANYTGNIHVKFTPKLKDGVELNPANKKQILDLNKSDANVYIQRLENSDHVKKFIEKWETIFEVKD